MTEGQLQFVLLLATLELAVVILFLSVLRLRIATRLGARGRSTRGTRRWRWVSIAVLWIGTAVLWAWAVEPSAREGPLLPLCLVVAAAITVVLVLSPSPDDRDLGANGVRAGWTAAAFTDFEEWRLVGEHLRFRIAGRLWDAVPIDPREAETLRERLCSGAPDRESRYAE